MKEYEVAGILEGYHRGHGADKTFNLVFSGPFPVTKEGIPFQGLPWCPGRREIEKGDCVHLEMTTVYGGYWNQLVRIVSVGSQNAELTRFHEATVATMQAGISAMKVGTKMSEAVQTMARVAEENNFKLTTPMGHFCGLDLVEGRFDGESQVVLKSGHNRNCPSPPGRLERKGHDSVGRNLPDDRPRPPEVESNRRHPPHGLIFFVGLTFPQDGFIITPECFHFGSMCVFSLEGTMAVNLSIKRVPEGVAKQLRRRATRHHRSLQGELLAILEESVRSDLLLTPEEMLAQVRKYGLKTREESAKFMRQDRNARSHR